MRLLSVWQFCGLGGVETALVQRIPALAKVGITAEVLFAEQLSQGGRHLAGHPGVHVGLSRRAMIDLLRQPWDLITIPDFPEFMEVVLEAHIATPVMLETHHSAPKLPRHYRYFESPRVAGVLVPSEFNRRLIARSGMHPAEVRVLPNALDTEAFRPRALDEIAEPYRAWADGPVVLWVGRLEGEKNLAEFVAGAEHIRRAVPSARFVVIGDTWDSLEHDEFLDAVRADLTPDLLARIHWRRHVPPADMPQVFALAAATGGCLVSSSRNESQPMIFLEAMACECPIVSSDIEGAVELVASRELARLYPLGDPEALAARVAELLDPRARVAREAMVRRGHDVVASEHSLAAMGSAFVNLIRDVQARATGGADAPLVSCVIPFLDGENFLAEAIESVVAQTWRNWELLLVDDGSTDASTALARGWAARDPRIRYFEHDGHANLGKSASRNLGIREARGKYLAFLDHDDTWLANKLADQVAFLETHPDVGMVFGRTRYWHSWTGRPTDLAKDGFTELVSPPDRAAKPPALATTYVGSDRGLPSTCSVLLRRALVDRVGGFEEDFPDVYEDVAFFLKVFLESPVFVADASWDSYRQHPGNSMSAMRRRGDWHPRRLNPRRRALLEWFDRYLADRGAADPALAAALAQQLEAYRSAAPPTPRDRYGDACLEAGLAVLRGEDPRGALDGLPRLEEPLDPAFAAEAFFDALDPSTDTALSGWLDVWNRCEPAILGFFAALEAHATIPGLASRALAMLRRLVEGEWWLRAGGEARARLRLLESPGDAIRVEAMTIDAGVAHEIQVNRPLAPVRTGERATLSFLARADAARPLAFGAAHNVAPWGNLGLYDRVDLTTAWQAVERSFTVTEDSEALRIHFDLGEDPTAIELAALTLRSLDHGRIHRRLGPAVPRPHTHGASEDDASGAAIVYGSLRRVTPIAPDFGIRRGQPVDRVYIERFIGAHADDIAGRVLELEDPNYTRRFGGHRVTASDVLHVVEGNSRATIVADLTKPNDIPDRHYDCVILTQTLQFIYDVPAAIRTVHRILKPGGVVLATVPGISQVPEVEEGCNWCWTFTAHSAGRLFGEAFGGGNVTTASRGNILTVVSLLHGITAGELTAEEFAYDDPNYPVIVSIRAVKA